MKMMMRSGDLEEVGIDGVGLVGVPGDAPEVLGVVVVDSS